MKLSFFFSLSFFLLLGTALGLQAQESETRKLDAFQKISVSGGVDVILKQGNSPSVKIEVEGIDLEDVETEIRGGTLHISMKKKGWNWSWGGKDKLRAEVTYTELAEVRASGASDVRTEGAWKGERLTLHLSGASDAKLELKAGHFEAHASGAGDVKAHGEAGTMDVHLSGASDFIAHELKVSRAELHCSGASDARLWVTDSLTGSASGSSDISYKGNPSTLKLNTSGAASIRSHED